MLNQRGNTLIIGILIGVLVAAGLFGAYYFGTKQHQPASTSITTAVPSSPTVATTQPVITQIPAQTTPSPTPAACNFEIQNYTSGQVVYGLAVNYSKDWLVKCKTESVSDPTLITLIDFDFAPVSWKPVAPPAGDWIGWGELRIEVFNS